MHNNFIERSIEGAFRFLKDSVFSDELASQKGFLQSLEVRIKTASVLLIMLQVLFSRNIFVLLCLYGLCLILARASNIRFGFFLKRTWIFIPIFALFIAIPAMFSIFTFGEALVSFKIFGLNLIITRQGFQSAILFVTRVATSVSFVVLLSITTKHFVLLRVLRVFKIPQIFVMTLGMCYRYIYLFVEMIENTYLAIKSRVGTRVSYKKGQHVVAWNIACLWSRSLQLNEEVYNAMLSRGYRGEPMIADDFKAQEKDWLFLVCVMFLFVVELSIIVLQRF